MTELSEPSNLTEMATEIGIQREQWGNGSSSVSVEVTAKHCNKGGVAHGGTDEYGYAAVEGKVHIHDWHATILHLLGLNHKRLTFNYAGRDFRLTDVHGNVVKEILA